MKQKHHFSCLAATALLTAIAVLASTNSSFGRGFLALPNPPGRANPDEVTRISGDGSILGGAASGIQLKPALWQADGQVVVLGDGTVDGRVQALSYNGQVAAGTIGTANPTGIFRWAGNGGGPGQFVDIGNPSGYRLTGVSEMTKTGNAMVVGGRELGPETTALGGTWRWTETAGFSRIEPPSGANAAATSISGDGSVVVGFLQVPWSDGPQPAWRWTAGGGLQQISFSLQRAWYSPSVPLISEDGQVIVFTETYNVDGFRGIRVVSWANGVGTPLPIPAGKISFHSTAVSADGNTILGYATDAQGGGAVAFRWTASGGMVALGISGTSLWFSPDETKILGRTATGLWSWDEVNGLVTVDNPSGTLISQDGSVVAGPGSGGTFWRWSRSSGVTVTLSTLAENSMNRILRLAGDGTAAWGASSTLNAGANSVATYWRWTPSTGYTPVTVMPDSNWENGRAFNGADVRQTQGPDTWWELVPWRWTEEQGLTTEPAVAIPNVSLGDYPAVGFSADGLTAAINIYSGSEEKPAMLWTRKNDFRSLAPIAAFDSQRGLSRDASVVAGFGNGTYWVWSATDGVSSFLPAGYSCSGNFMVSADGNVVAGGGWEPLLHQDALLRWTRQAGTQVIVFGTFPQQNWSSFVVTHMSADGNTIMGIKGSGIEQRAWRWTAADGFEILGVQDQATSVTSISTDGSVIYMATSPGDEGLWRWTRAGGLRSVRDDFPPNTWLAVDNGNAFGSKDGTVAAGYARSPLYMNQSWIAAYAPVIEKLSVQSAVSGGGDVPIIIYGLGFEAGAKVLAGTTELTPTSITETEIRVTLPASLLTTALDFATLEVKVVCPGGDTSRPAGFTVIGANVGGFVSALETAVATPGTTASVEILPATESSGGLSASLTVNSTATTASVTVATYISDPSASGNTSFDVAGQFLDLNASGVTAADSLQAFFYFPAGTPANRLVLKFWNTRLPTPAWDDVSPINIDPVLRRIDVVFNATSHPAITELDGTFFAPAILPPIQFTGFLSPIGGADATGGSFAAPLKTFKAGSTIPVKFSATRGGAPLTTGVHRLQALKFSDATTSGTPIDATPQDAAFTGNQFRLVGSEWQFNLDMKSTGIAKGIWKLVATLSDGSQHVVWVQIK